MRSAILGNDLKIPYELYKLWAYKWHAIYITQPEYVTETSPQLPFFPIRIAKETGYYNAPGDLGANKTPRWSPVYEAGKLFEN